jgi:hypothetical protein
MPTLERLTEEFEREQAALSRVVTRDYFPTVGARLREGRFFEISDGRSDARHEPARRSACRRSSRS